MPKVPRRTEVQITLRVIPETYQGLKAAAAEEGRSLNRQIERVLEEWLRRRKPEGQGQPPPA
jgi:hypothetical protein